MKLDVPVFVEELVGRVERHLGLSQGEKSFRCLVVVLVG